MGTRKRVMRISKGESEEETWQELARQLDEYIANNNN